MDPFSTSIFLWEEEYQQKTSWYSTWSSKYRSGCSPRSSPDHRCDLCPRNLFCPVKKMSWTSKWIFSNTGWIHQTWTKPLINSNNVSTTLINTILHPQKEYIRDSNVMEFHFIPKLAIFIHELTRKKIIHLTALTAASISKNRPYWNLHPKPIFHPARPFIQYLF